MRTEEECKPHQRFLFAAEYFSDKAIKIWQEECIKRFKEKEKGELYYQYINWTRKENQIAVFTLYAYADFDIPKKFDCVFRLDKPSENLQIDFELTHCIWEAWVSMDKIIHGHKHLCVFTFDDKIPEILNLLYKEDSIYSTSPKDQISLGFCSSEDLEAIATRRMKVFKLKELYGDKWWEHDDGE